MAEKLDPERARDLLNSCFEHLVPIVEKYEGTNDKFVGDEIVALFGAPVAHENDAERACRAALEMMSAITLFNSTNNADLGLHFGINTGRVVAGGVGTRARQDYSVMGYAVNMAARFEDASQRGEIFVGEHTQRMAAPFFEFEPKTLAVKGASKPVTAYRLLNVRKEVGPTRGIEGLSSPLVGREAELAALQNAIAALHDGSGGIVAVIGEAGIGKTRLLSEARGSGRGVSWHEGRTLAHTSALSYWLARDLLRDVLGFDGAQAPADEARVLSERLSELLGNRAPRVYALVAWLLELPLEPDAAASISELTGPALQRQTTEAVAAFLLASAVVQPIVLVCEDLHWADPSSLQMLAGLLPLTANAPLLFVFALRPDDDQTNDFLADAARQHGEAFLRGRLKSHRASLATISLEAAMRMRASLLAG